jgi:hypothetical protein
MLQHFPASLTLLSVALLYFLGQGEQFGRHISYTRLGNRSRARVGNHPRGPLRHPPLLFHSRTQADTRTREHANTRTLPRSFAPHHALLAAPLSSILLLSPLALLRDSQLRGFLFMAKRSACNYASLAKTTFRDSASPTSRQPPPSRSPL